MENKGKKLYIQEVAPRDGFQNERQFIDTEDKIAFIDKLSASGFAKIEVTSFTSPKAIPALRDAEMVMHRIQRHPDVIYTVLVPMCAARSAPWSARSTRSTWSCPSAKPTTAPICA